ncbi:MAG: hypothetical protein IJS57_03090 [Paludibacteraceae bacterium]|nr:hypothetical protein [Paludibacteraceae bacterium]
MKNEINRAFEAKKKLMILAISAVLVANVSAQENKREFKGKQLSKEERVEKDIHHLTHELYLSDAQAEKFAVTYREYAAKKAELFEKNAPKQKEPRKELTDAELDKLAKNRFETQKKLTELDEAYYTKFRKDLTARQVAKVLRLEGPCGPKPEGCPQHESAPQREHKKAHSHAHKAAPAPDAKQ